MAQGGFLVTQLAPQSAAESIGLKRLDIIAGINGAAVPAEAGQDFLPNTLKNAGVGSTAVLNVHSLEEHELTVTLGRRPVQLMNATDLAEARVRFAAWWRQQVGDTTLALLPSTNRGVVVVTPAATQPALPEPALEP